VVICDGVHLDSASEMEDTPRAMLKKQVGRLEKRGYTAMMASELEFYCSRRRISLLQRRCIVA